MAILIRPSPEMVVTLYVTRKVASIQYVPSFLMQCVSLSGGVMTLMSSEVVTIAWDVHFFTFFQAGTKLSCRNFPTSFAVVSVRRRCQQAVQPL